MAQAAPRVVRLDDYRRNCWSAIDLTWEHVTLQAVKALAREERLRVALLMPQVESIARLHTSPDDPRRAATLTLLARWQQRLGNDAAAQRLQADAERAWCAAAAWLDRLRPGRSPEGQAECRRLLQRATTFTTALDAAGSCCQPVHAITASLAGLPADQRKLEAAVALAMASLELDPATSEALP